MNIPLHPSKPEKRAMPVVSGRVSSGVDSQCGFTLIEVLVSITLLSVMILGLVAMFDQTRKAFTSSFTQVDVLESGRNAADIIARDFEQMAAIGGNYTNINFYAAPRQLLLGLGSNLLQQQLNDPAEYRTNLFYETIFLTRNNSTYKDLDAVGYRMNQEAYTNGVGSLYRFSNPTNNPIQSTTSPYVTTNNSARLQVGILENVTTNDVRMSKLIDGVVHFRIRAFDINGTPWGEYLTNGYYRAYPTFGGTNYSVSTTNLAPWAPNPPEEMVYYFQSNAIPAYVEIELGVLEDRALKRFNAISSGSPGAGLTYLTNHAGLVHVFRQRITIKSAANATFQ